MKKILTLAVVAFSSAIFFQSCTYEQGGGTNTIINNVVLPIYEIEADFTEKDNHLFNLSPALHKTDKLLVYRLWGQSNGRDVWRLIPNTVYFNNGDVLSYNYDFTTVDLNIFIETNFNVGTFNVQDANKYLRKQIFRVIELPAGANKNRIDYNNYEQTIKHLGLENAKIIKK